MNKLNMEYKKVVEKDIPYRQLNHGTLASFLQSIPTVMRLSNQGGELVVTLVRDGQTESILTMVQEQKKPKKSRGNYKPARQPRGPSAWVPTVPCASSDRGLPGQRPLRPSAWRGAQALRPNNSQRPNNLPRPNHPLLLNTSNTSPNLFNAASKHHSSKPSHLEANEAKSSNKPVKTGLYYDDGTWKLPRAIRHNHEKQFAPYYEVPPRFNNNTKTGESKPTGKSYKQQLEEEVKKLNKDEMVVFRTIPWGKKKQYWLSTVTIGKNKVNSYPEEKEKPEDAEELVAKNALELVQQLLKKSLPITVNLEVSISRVKELLRKENIGTLWWVKVQELYQHQYQEVFPENWLQSVRSLNNSGLIIENLCSDRWAIRLVEETKTCLTQPTPYSSIYEDLLYSSQSEHGVRQTNYQEEGDYREGVTCFSPVKDDDACVRSPTSSLQHGDHQIPTLNLPCSNYWDVFITYIEDFNNINFRLVGDEYSNAYDDLLTDMELYYMEEKNLSPVSEPHIGGIYAANHDESWFRVEVLNLFGNKVTVRFVDHGDDETIDLRNLHHLQKNFFALPAQNVSCSLAGLEYARKDASAVTLLQNLALGQTLVAQILSRQKPISLILFNTTTDEDININQKVSEHLDHNFVEPVLPAVGGLAEVYLMHVTTAGDVYVQIESETYKMLENLLEMARNRAEEMLGESAEIDLTRLYLARFSEDGEWYRAAPRSNIDPDGKVLMWFVDFGNSDRVPSTNLRPLEGGCDQLTKIPHQALQCRLHNVPPSIGLKWTTRACQRLLELSPEDSPLLLKVQAAGINGGPPSVELFKRLQPQNELVSINATLSLDSTLFSNDGDRNNNSVEKIVLSPTRTRSRQSSSASQSSSSHGNSGPSSMNSQYESTPASPRLSSSSRPESPLDLCVKQKPAALVPQEIPSVGAYFDVYVTYAANPTNFAVQSWKMTQKLSSLMSKMQTFYDDASNYEKNMNIEVGGFYAVKHNDDTWYRAHMTMVHQDIVTGLFVDYGDCFVLSRDRVQPLPSSFRHFPYQAIKAKLYGIIAANKDWSPEDSCRFQELVEYREFVSVVMDVEKENEYSVTLSLQLIDTTDPKLDIYIDQILVDEGRAVKKGTKY
ncbi:tudor domain-containing protein 7B-like isoform X2 [Panulirus ornatus]